MTLKPEITRLAVCGLLIIMLFLPSISFADLPSLGLLDSIRSALKNQPDIESGQLNVEYAEQTYQEASGQFDTSVEARVAHGETRTTSSYTDSKYSVGLGRQLRSGLQISTELDTTRAEIEPYEAKSSTGVYLVASLPLLRGFGTDVVAGMETAARQDAEASRVELRHAISQVVYKTSLAYWNYVLNYLNLQQYREAEKRAQEMFEQTRALVEVDELSASELDESRANLSDKRTVRIGVEQAYLESRLDLGMAMGVPFEQIRRLPPPKDEFSLVDIKRDVLSQIDSLALIEYAVMTRDDLQASKIYEKSIATRVKVVADQLRPKIDVGMKVGYEGHKEGNNYLDMNESWASNVPGASWQVALTYEFSIENRTAEGQLGQQRQEKRRQELRSRELTRSIKSNVHMTLAVLRQTIMELENARHTVALYEKAVANKLMEFRLGMGTQLDLINTQDNLTQARLRSIEARYKEASTLSRLRFQTASLVSFVKDEAHVDLDSLTSVPRIPLHQ